MHKLQSLIRFKKVSVHVLLMILLTGCSTHTARYIGSTSTKMAHHTTILDHQTHRSSDASSQASSDVNFEYEEIITQ